MTTEISVMYGSEKVKACDCDWLEVYGLCMPTDPRRDSGENMYSDEDTTTRQFYK